MRRGLVALVLFLAASFGYGPVLAGIQRTALQYKRAVWSSEEGAPADVAAITQGPDGQLLLGSSSGLFGFDGITFTPIAPINDGHRRSEQVTVLHTARSGDVWVGYEYGGLAVYSGGRLRDATGEPPSGMVTAISEAPDGAIWVAAMGKKLANLRRFSHGRWEDVGQRLGLPQAMVRNVLAARDGSVWVVAGNALLVLPSGATRFVRTGERIRSPSTVSLVGLAEDTQGHIWLSDVDSLRTVSAPGTPATTLRYPLGSQQQGHTLFSDRAGDLWDVGLNDVVEIADPARPASALRSIAQRVSSTDQTRTGANASSIYEDREGNIWIGTLFGVTSLRLTSVVAEPEIPAKSRTDYAGIHGSDGSAYILSKDKVFQLDGLAGPRKIATVGGVPTGGCVSRQGGLVVTFDDHFLKLQEGRPAHVGPPPGIKSGIEGLCVFDDQGHMWTSVTGHGVYELDHGIWSKIPVLPTEPDNWPLSVTNGADGSVFMAFADRTIIRLHAGGRSIMRLAAERSPGMISTLMPTADGTVYAAGDRGITRLRAGEARLVSAERFPYLKNLGGMAQTPDGWTWLAGAAGLARVRTAQFQRSFDDPGLDVPARLFGMREGLPGTPTRWADNDLITDRAGQVWVSTNAGVARILPSALVSNRVKPPVAIRGVVADGVRYPPAAAMVLPRGTRNLQIDYTAYSFSDPQRVGFRYRINGVDADWVNAGPRRQAFYANLGPGTYRFQVIASNNDGVWNDTGAEVSFTIKPTFLQSRWFALACVGVGGLVLWLLYRLRVRAVEAGLRSRLEIRMNERETIARDLHDNLLQSVQGVFLRFQAFADRVPPQDPSRDRLEGTLARAQQVIDEARDRVSALREPADQVAIVDIVEQAIATIPFFSTARVERRIDPRLPTLKKNIAGEVQAILGESLFNAERHAAASRIVVTAEGIDRRIVISVRDDGVGIPPSIVEAGRRAGHFGLIGMRERAEQAGGRLEIGNLADGGAQTVVSLPCPDLVGWRSRLTLRRLWRGAWDAMRRKWPAR